MVAFVGGQHSKSGWVLWLRSLAFVACVAFDYRVLGGGRFCLGVAA